MTAHETLFCETLDNQQRLAVPYEIYGLNFVRVESVIFDFAARLCRDYDGAFWRFMLVSNGAFYACPAENKLFTVRCENGFEGTMSADAFGLTCVLYSTSHLSFDGSGKLAQACGEQHHLLRDWMAQHDEVRAILAAID